MVLAVQESEHEDKAVNLIKRYIQLRCDAERLFVMLEEVLHDAQRQTR